LPVGINLVIILHFIGHGIHIVGDRALFGHVRRLSLRQPRRSRPATRLSVGEALAEGVQPDDPPAQFDRLRDVLEFLTDFEPEAVSLGTRRHVDPSELTLEGKLHGQDVLLHLCLEPPEDAEATEILDLSGDGGPVVRDKE